MTESMANIDDLEDGEIESDGENANDATNDVSKEGLQLDDEKMTEKKIEQQEVFFLKQGKKKKSKSHKGDQKFKDKNKKNRKYAAQFQNVPEGDFAGSVQKAIRKAMNKNEEDEMNMEEEVEDRRKHKKRKKYEGKDAPAKKRKKQEFSDEMDESEMMCVRGASPVHRGSPVDAYADDDRDSYASDSSHEESRGHQQPQRRRQQQRNKNNKNDRRRGAHPMQDPDGVCVYFMQGKCHKGDDCIFSHDALPPRKMELCKFYLMDCCAKRDKCLYMHADFPCKYYHTGLPCIYKDDCKFAHGKPLTENLKNILLKHIESAPKEILGDFPRLNREGALKMMQTTQTKLMQQYAENFDNQERSIPSLFELNIPNPQNTSLDSQIHHGNERQNKISPKVRQSRWHNDNSNQNFNLNISPSGSVQNTGTNVLSIKNLTGVLTPRQISDLTKMGIENLDQLGQLTVLQLNSIGISAKQITEIQLNTMSIQKLGLINSSTEQQPQAFLGTVSSNKDLDLRVPPMVPTINNLPVPDLPGKDIDMRLQPTGTINDESSTSKTDIKPDFRPNKDMIDIDQYTKDALKFATKDKENVDVSNEAYENEKTRLTNESKDVDHRVLPFADESSRNAKPTFEETSAPRECDVDIRFLPPEPLFKYPEKKHRRSTTDDEDNNLLIDEKWYSSDEEKGPKKKSPASSPRMSLSPQAPAPRVIEPSAVLSKLGDLSKIDISEDVTKLLNTMRNNLQENKTESVIEAIGSPRSRDPRSRRSPDNKLNDLNKPNKKPQRISIYECVDGEPTDGRRRSDVDLRQTDFNLPTFGDTDLRQGTSGDIDLRLGIPFKAIPNYTPASEIDGSINSHPHMVYKLVTIDIPRPDYTDIRNSTAKSQALLDPRLRKVFRLSIDESNSDSEKSTKVAPAAVGPRIDPRRKPKDTGESGALDQKFNTLDIQTILQNSNWYKEMSSTQKIFVNQHLAPITQMIKQYQQDKTSGKQFDVSVVQNNSILCGIFTNLGVSLGENGEFSYLPKPKDALLKTPLNYNQSSNPFNMNSNIPGTGMDPNNLNLMNIPPMNIAGGMNPMNVGHLQNYNQPFSDPRGGPGPAPGLLGIAPNIPHNFNNNFGNMGFNGPGPGNDYNNYDGEQNYQRFPNRGGHRGRGNERWNRGGPGRGHRDRKNFNDRGSWKH
ncbi:suppressor of sable RNA-binding protein isoform X2 [Choristoneura fumiferana]